MSFGEAGELGHRAVQNLHAPALHLLAIAHTWLTCKYQGRESRMADVRGIVVEELLA